MRWEQYIDPDEVRKAISVLQAPDQVFEVRVIGASSKKDILSGYFRDAETLLKNFDNIEIRGRNVYITLGEVKEECFARSQSEHFERNTSTTSDPEIARYRWLFIDLDPVRAAGISSSETELKAAEELCEKVKGYLHGLGFHDPVIALSGNGYHLLYRIDVPNNAECRALVEKCLKNLSALFDTDLVKIDTTNSNPSRICKLHGTLAQKGTSTARRPHRMSKLITVPGDVKINNKDLLAILAGELPDEPVTPSRKTNAYQTQQFDLIDFLHRNGITYTEDDGDRSKIFKLDECPFDHNHRNGDAKIFWYQDGAIAFKCHHNSCRQYRWQDVRLKFDPDAYDHDYTQDDERIDAGYREHLSKRTEDPRSAEKQAEKKTKQFRKLKTADSLMKKDIPEPKVFIGVDNELPILVEGTCILSAKPKLGKSWLALSMCLAVANGVDFLGYKTRKCSTLYLDLETSEAIQKKRIRKALAGAEPPSNFYIETETDTIENGFVDQIEHYLAEDPGIGVVVIDVFQIIRSPAKSMKETEYEHAYRDITPLNELAQKYHISIILVCHDRKAVDLDDPFANILGSTGLQGAASQMIVMFRKHKDDPIHISVKGKTIDGLPEPNVQLDNAQWSIVEGVNSKEREEAEMMSEYMSSDVRKVILKLAEDNTLWKGRSSTIISEAVGYGIGLEESPKHIGGFLHKHQGRFLKVDGIKIAIIDNGTGGKTYRIEKDSENLPLMTVDTVDSFVDVPLMNHEDAHGYWSSEIPFL